MGKTTKVNNGGGGGHGGKGHGQTITNSDPTAVIDYASVNEDSPVTIDVLANDTDPNGDLLSVTGLGTANYGTVTLNSDGTVTYVPLPDFYGTDSFSYTISDGNGGTSTATVEVTVNPVNDPPVAVDDSYTAQAGTTFSPSVSLLANDYDVDGDALSVYSYDTTSAHGGTVSVDPAGKFSYTPTPGFVGADTFSYTVDDGHGGQDTATATIQVEDSTAVPYYVSALLAGDTYRLNYPAPDGTGDTVTFAFLHSVPNYYSSTSWVQDGFQAFTAEQQEATREALQMISHYTNLTFVETSPDQAEMTFAFATSSAEGHAYYPSYDGVGNVASDVWLSADFADTAFTQGSSIYTTLLHEIGHAIGLRHPDSLPFDENSKQYSVMAGPSHPTMDGEPVTHMLYDIAAVQYLYGANMQYATGDDVYNFAALDGKIQAIWDAGGHDTFDLSAATYGVHINLGDGEFSTVAASGTNNLAIAFNTTIEDVVGSHYSDVLIGNEVANVITGGGGGDIMTGGAGNDVFVIGTGDTCGGTAIGADSNGNGVYDLLEGGSAAVAASGTDVITDFKTGDTIDLSGLTGVTSASQVASGTTLAATGDGNVFVLEGNGANGVAAGDALLLVNTGGGEATALSDFEVAVHLQAPTQDTWDHNVVTVTA